MPFSDRGSRLMVFQTPHKSELFIKLAERLTFIDSNLEAYLQRPPFISNLVLLDEAGEGLDFKMTAYPHMLYLTTRLGDFCVAFKDNHTIAFGIPPGITAGISFQVSPRIWQVLESGGQIKSVRDFTYVTNSRVVRNHIRSEDGGYNVELVVEADDDATIAISIGSDRQLPKSIEPFSSILESSQERWQGWFKRVPPVAEHFRRTYAYAWWVMANNLVKPKGTIYYEAMMPSKSHYVGLWLWDSAMHALAYRHLDPELARNQIRAMIACQLPDGMLPDAIYDEGVVSQIDHPILAEVTKPPILSWAVLKLHETSPDLAFLQEVYIPLVRCNAWWFSMNDDDVDGLSQYNHPYSSGLDDNPLWDYGMPVESPDINTYLCIQMNSLARMAELLGMDAEAAMWQRRAKAIVNRMIEDFWDETAGVFYATREDEPIPVVTPFNLYPLWTGQLPNEMANRLIAHLCDPNEFWTDYGIPSVARNDPHFNPEQMWRGPVWVNINYFFIEALQLAGRADLARTLRKRTLDLIMSSPGMYEYYNADSGKPGARAAEAFGWTAAVFIDLAIAASREEEPTLALPPAGAEKG
ncbi:MAG: hypothetical protein HPY76_11440 [Anaerolineae bacterium]|nr:hypothetical protein [Anaerolineae bacterium]